MFTCMCGNYPGTCMQSPSYGVVAFNINTRVSVCVKGGVSRNVGVEVMAVSGKGVGNMSHCLPRLYSIKLLCIHHSYMLTLFTVVTSSVTHVSRNAIV